MIQKKKIKVLWVEDSGIASVLIKKLLKCAEDIELVGLAKNGKDALDMLHRLKPDIICTDLMMPVMDGYELIRRVMSENPIPVLVVSDYVSHSRKREVFEALEAGALDVFQKPKLTDNAKYEEIAEPLLKKIRLLSGIKVFKKRYSVIRNDYKKAGVLPKPTAFLPRLIIIGSSTGGPKVLRQILSPLPEDFPFPIVCIQHISAGFLGGLVSWLDRECHLKVKVAESGEELKPGMVYFSVEERHLVFSVGGYIKYKDGESFKGHKPSVTVCMMSAVERFGEGLVGILLTGMGDDGALGMLRIREAGGETIAQNKETSLIYGMPGEAVKLGAVLYELAPEGIVDRLFQYRKNWQNLH